MQGSAASLAVPLAASLLGCLAVLALIALVLVLYARNKRRRSAAASAQMKGAALPITVAAGTPQQVRVHPCTASFSRVCGDSCTPQCVAQFPLSFWCCALLMPNTMLAATVVMASTTELLQHPRQ